MSTALRFQRPNICTGGDEHVPLSPSIRNVQSAAMVASPERHCPVSEYKGIRALPGLGGGGLVPSNTTRPVATAPRPTAIDTESSPPLTTVILAVPYCSSSGRVGP